MDIKPSEEKRVGKKGVLEQKKYLTLPCKQCLSPFLRLNYQQIYCSDKCRRDFWIVLDKEQEERRKIRQHKYNKTPKARERTSRFRWSSRGLFRNILNR